MRPPVQRYQPKFKRLPGNTQDERTKKDAGATARAYLENSQQGVEGFEQIGKLVDKYVELKYDGSDKSNYNTMKCIDLFQTAKNWIDWSVHM